MPMPQEYFHASREFDRLIVDIRDSCMLQTHHQAYHTLRAVLHVFRAHLTVEETLRFAATLPAVARAILIEDWQASAPAPFPERTTLIREVKAIRPDHNLAPETAIEDVAGAVRRSVDVVEFDRVLKTLPEGATNFWESRDPS